MQPTVVVVVRHELAHRKAEQDLLERTEMRMMKRMVRIEKIKTGEIKEKAGVIYTSEKNREARLNYI